MSDRTRAGFRVLRWKSGYRRFVRRLRRFPWALAAIFFLLSLGLAATGIIYHRTQIRQVRKAYEKALPAVSGAENGPVPVPFGESEIYASLQGRGFVVLSLLLPLILAAAGGVFMVLYRQLSRLENRQLLSEVERLSMAQRYEFLSRYAHDVIFFLDERLRVVEANERAAEVYGYSGEEMRALGLEHIRSPDAAAEEKAHLALVKKKDSHVFETVHRKKNGASFPVEVSARVVEAGGMHFYQYIVRDISYRKAAEAELRRHREHLEEIVAERTEELRMSNDRMRREVEVRRLAEQRSLRQGRVLRGINRVLGESLTVAGAPDAARICLEEAVSLTESAAGFIEDASSGDGGNIPAGAGGRTGKDIFSHSGDERRLNFPIIGSYREITKREGKTLVVNEGIPAERIRKRPSSHPAPRSFLGVPLRHEGLVMGVMGLLDKSGGYTPEDRSDAEALASALSEVLKRKRSERTIRNLNAELAKRVTELTAANQELDAFSYSVAHDLRAPLRAVAGFAGLLEDEYGSVLDAEARRRLGVISGNVKMMNDLLDKLLSLSRLSRQPLAYSRIDMASLAGEVFQELNSQETGREIVLELGAMPSCRADKNLIRQVLFNLMSNAFKFTRTRQRAELKFWGETGAVEVTYALQDNGVGFDQHYAHKLFCVFQRLHPPGEFEGTGVGLAIVQRIVRLHGGRVWAEGILDRGAVFSFSLPLDLLAGE